MKYAEKYLTRKEEMNNSKQIYNIYDNDYVNEMIATLERLKNNSDSKTQKYINFRKSNRINGLSTRLIDTAQLPQKLI